MCTCAQMYRRAAFSTPKRMYVLFENSRLLFYFSIVTTSSEIAKKFIVSHKDKNFENLKMLDKALRASELLSLVDGSRLRPSSTTDNTTGYKADSLIMTVDAGGMPSYIVAAADDCYKYHKESIVAFTFMLSMVHKDMHHLLLDLIRIYRAIQDYFKVVRTTMWRQLGRS